MIRGAIILAVGFGLGYAKAMSEQEAIAALGQSLRDSFEEFREEQRKDKESSKTDDDAPEESVSDTPEVVEDDEVTDPEAEGEPS